MLVRQTNELGDLFALSIKTNAICVQCHTNERKTEPEYQLILSCQGTSHIDQAIDREFASESRSDIECDSKTCKKERVKKEYHRKLARGPDILCTQFNRSTVTGLGTQKSTQVVEFNQELDLSRITKHETSLRYRLMSAVHHQGTLGGGHYISVTKTPEDRWSSQDNEKVYNVGLNWALRPKRGFTPYLLFWAKIPPEEPRKSPSSKKRPHEEAADPELDETIRSHAKRGSKKRSREVPEDATLEETDRPRSKSPKTDNVPADATAQIDSNPELASNSRWPSNWLWGNFGSSSKKAQQAEQELSNYRQEQQRKDQQIEHQKDLIRRAAVSHKQLIGIVARLNGALEASLRATESITPLMRDLQARGGKHKDKASRYLKAEGRAKGLRTEALGRYVVNGHMARLVEGGLEKNQTLEGFDKGCEEAVTKDTLESWLDEELRRSDLPNGGWRGGIP
ncbi:MAG: hypothetical protein Q9225_004272 [Loekoesia sp. 1 TL-2023]